MARSRRPQILEASGIENSFSNCSILRKRTCLSPLSFANFIFSDGKEMISLSAK